MLLKEHFNIHKNKIFIIIFPLTACFTLCAFQNGCLFILDASGLQKSLNNKRYNFPHTRIILIYCVYSSISRLHIYSDHRIF